MDITLFEDFSGNILAAEITKNLKSGVRRGLVGKWVKCAGICERGPEMNEWVQIEKLCKDSRHRIVLVGTGSASSRSWHKSRFDLSDPRDEKPTTKVEDRKIKN